MLKMLGAEIKKIKRQKFILLTVLAACLFPIPLTIVIVHSKLNYDTLLMFVMEFGFFLVFPIVLGIIASILFRMENENGTLKTLSVIPVPRWKLLSAKVIIIYILAVFYGVAAIGATMIGGLSHQPPLQVVVCSGPPRGLCCLLASKAGAASSVTGYRYKAAPSLSSFLDSSDCSLTYFLIASSVTLPIVAT